MFKFIIKPIKNRLAARRLKKAHRAGMIFPPEFAGYDHSVALNLARLSEWSYPQGKALSKDYDNEGEFLLDMAKKKKKAVEWGFNDFNYVYGEDFKILVFILRKEADIIIVFRGTVVDSIVNWIKDFQALLIPMDCFGSVHKGFSVALDSVWAGIKNHIAPGENQKIWLTGHSLGGALALITGARLITEYRKCPNIIINGIYVFAAPRVGDQDFAESFKNTYLEHRSFVFANYNDVVTVFPLTIQKISEYMNVGNILTINEDGIINPIQNLSQFKILREFITGYFKEQFLMNFKEKIVHDWQSFKRFFREVFAEIKPAFTEDRKESEYWSRFKDFFTRENGNRSGREIESQSLPDAGAPCEEAFMSKDEREECEQDRLSSIIWELFVELFIELNPYVIESHDIATYIKSLEKVTA